VSKKQIIMIAGAGLVSFAGMFAFSLTKTAPQSQQEQLSEPVPVSEETELKLPQPQAELISEAGNGETKRAMTEKRLKSLVYEVGENLGEYKSKLQGLEAREQRLQIAQSVLKKDIKELDNLRIELASIVSGLKSEQDKLLKSRVKIARAEKANLISIAAAYDKMDSASAGKILTNMCRFSRAKKGDWSSSQIQDSGAESSFNDAVKILYYMTERTKAKLLAELVTSEPKLAAVFCQRLKQIIEVGPQTQ
jgi:flagellar motility protein MotE (MotC chaperone)